MVFLLFRADGECNNEGSDAGACKGAGEGTGGSYFWWAGSSFRGDGVLYIHFDSLARAVDSTMGINSFRTCPFGTLPSFHNTSAQPQQYSTTTIPTSTFPFPSIPKVMKPSFTCSYFHVLDFRY